MGYYDFGYFRPSVPRRVKGGIKAQSKNGSFGENWWAKRWIDTLESFNIGARLVRGRRYARSGQVLSIEIVKGCVTSEVQGSRMTPYHVEIHLRPFTSGAWKRFVDALIAQPYYMAILMNGRIPDEIEEVFKIAKLSMFPAKMNDLKTTCSCPDWSNPCKHIAAVYYLLGEEFDRNPFLIFTLRGIEQKALLSLVHKNAPARQDTENAGRKVKRKSHSVRTALPTDPDSFWGKSDARHDFLGEIAVPETHAALPKRLGNFPFWRGEKIFIDTLAAMYEEASEAGFDIVAGDFGGNEEKPDARIYQHKTG
jgi:uncharacterized Zn finger protein